MKKENQVCTLEQGKRLKELGIVQESLFYQYRGAFIDVIVEADFFKKYTSKIASYSAFTVAELGVMLPTYDDCVGQYYTIKDVGKLAKDESIYDIEGWNISESFS